MIWVVPVLFGLDYINKFRVSKSIVLAVLWKVRIYKWNF